MIDLNKGLSGKPVLCRRTSRQLGCEDRSNPPGNTRHVFDHLAALNKRAPPRSGPMISSRPERITVGILLKSCGYPGTGGHLALDLFMSMSGTTFTQITYSRSLY